MKLVIFFLFLTCSLGAQTTITKFNSDEVFIAKNSEAAVKHGTSEFLPSVILANVIANCNRFSKSVIIFDNNPFGVRCPNKQPHCVGYVRFADLEEAFTDVVMHNRYLANDNKISRIVQRYDLSRFDSQIKN